MAQRPVVRWNASAGAWVRFPDGTRKKVERVDHADAQRDLDELLSARALGSTPETKNVRQATFDEIIDGGSRRDVRMSRRPRHRATPGSNRRTHWPTPDRFSVPVSAR